jgi:vanillate O-demethylase monooxygenase subunit
MFLKNFWYVAAWDNELGEKPLGRTILNEPVVLFRGSDGKAVAMEDKCPHRRVPLSMGHTARAARARARQLSSPAP